MRPPGHLEVDLVYHSGPSAAGDLVYTLQMVDVATGWFECVAILGRSYRVMCAAFERCLARIPFPV
ncbi:MAG: integrase, partial [Anaerolineales bacterium]